MKTKKTVQKFSRDVDAGLHHLEPAQWKGSPEYLELLELSRVLAGQDFSEASHKQAVLGRVRNKTYNQQEEKIMKMNAKLRRPVIILASLLVAGVLSISIVKPSFAQELLDRALNKINLGNIIASQMDPDETQSFPEAWKGKLYDKNGNKIEDNTKKLGEVYNAEGEQIVNFDGDKLITKSEQEQRDKEAEANRLIVKDPAELDRYALFTVKLPKYLPEGFAFDHGEFSKGEQGVNGKYLDLIFTSEKIGQKLSMQFRYSDEETAYEMSTSGKMEKVRVNGADAVMMDDRSLDWEADGVLYSVNTSGLDRSEVLKIAESIR